MRGSSIAMIFQDPRGSLNPIKTIGRQISEIPACPQPHVDCGGNGAHLRPSAGSESVRQRVPAVPLPAQRRSGAALHDSHGHGMAAPGYSSPTSPTSNLDTTTQADVLARLQRIRSEHHSAIILITHNMGVIAQMADEIAVMYAGSVGGSTATRSRSSKRHCTPTRGACSSRLRALTSRTRSCNQFPARLPTRSTCRTSARTCPGAPRPPTSAAEPSAAAHGV